MAYLPKFLKMMTILMILMTILMLNKILKFKIVIMILTIMKICNTLSCPGITAVNRKVRMNHFKLYCHVIFDY